jgi:hypothetical protein
MNAKRAAAFEAASLAAARAAPSGAASAPRPANSWNQPQYGGAGGAYPAARIDSYANNPQRQPFRMPAVPERRNDDGYGIGDFLMDNMSRSVSIEMGNVVGGLLGSLLS